MNQPRALTLVSVVVLLLGAGPTPDPMRNALPSPAPKMASPPGRVLFSDDFKDGDLVRWKPDRPDVWVVRRGMARADLPDQKQEKSFLYAGSERWTDYAVDLDVCAMRGVDKGVVVRAVESETGIAVDLRGPGYQDVLLQRREWPLAKARVVNGNAQWHHLRVEARGHRYRVWVNGTVVLDKEDGRKARPNGGIALAAYTGGGGECTVYYDNVLVTELTSGGSEAEASAGGR